MIKLLDNQKQTRLTGKYDSLEWVLDTRAFNHMTSYKNFLTDLKYVLSCSIGLPNGSQSISKEIGTVVFDDQFNLKNVLFVPDLRCNLISASQVIVESDCVIQIANKGCVLHDL